MGFDEGQVRAGELGFDGDQGVAGLLGQARDDAAQLFGVETQAGGDAIQMLVLEVLRGKLEAEGRLVVHDHAAIAVEDFAARSGERDGLDAIALGQLTVDVVIAHLQNPESADQEQEHGYGYVLEYGDARQGEAGIVLQQPAGRIFGSRAIGFSGMQRLLLEATRRSGTCAT